MAINYNDPYNQGIGTPYLGDMNLGQVPVDNMQVAEVFNTPQSLMDIGAVKPGKVYGYNLTPQGEVLEDFRNSAFNMREKGPTSGANVQTQFNRMLGIPSSFKDVIENQEYIQDAINKGFLKEESDWENQKSFADPDNLQASLDDDEYDFSGIEGQTAGLPAAGKLWDIYRALQLAKRTKKYGPKVIGAITGLGKKAQGAQGAVSQAAANAAAAGQRREGRGGTHMSRSRDRGGLGISQSQAQAVSDANRAAGMSGWGLARGGRVSYFDGGLASLWPR